MAFFSLVFDKIIIWFILFGYEMITANSVLCTLLPCTMSYSMCACGIILTPVLFLFAGHWDQCTCCYLLHCPLGKNERQKESKEVSQNILHVHCTFSISIWWISG